jgi:hypothetical protein
MTELNWKLDVALLFKTTSTFKNRIARMKMAVENWINTFFIIFGLRFK